MASSTLPAEAWWDGRGVLADVDKCPVHGQTNNTQMSRTSKAPFIQAPWSRVSPTAYPLALGGAETPQWPLAWYPACSLDQPTLGPQTHACRDLGPSKWGPGNELSLRTSSSPPTLRRPVGLGLARPWAKLP